MEAALRFLSGLGCSDELIAALDGSNTAREIYGRLLDRGEAHMIRKVCEAARLYCREGFRA